MFVSVVNWGIDLGVWFGSRIHDPVVSSGFALGPLTTVVQEGGCSPIVRFLLQSMYKNEAKDDVGRWYGRLSGEWETSREEM